ncbi:DUF2523 family protein [Pseudoxanthomonas putridarboris]|uniref:DUF2523 family protein n=1 Tax=Pseudoxanthomonas putridarboris TaxID=752605 RepID=A0ABU9IZJ1_9GAMM
MGMVSDWISDAVMHLLGKTKELAAGIVGRVLATFGLTTVTFSSVLPDLKAFISQYTGGLSPETLNLLGYLEVGTVMSMILSALTVRLAWKVFIVPKAIADQLPGAS